MNADTKKGQTAGATALALGSNHQQGSEIRTMVAQTPDNLQTGIDVNHIVAREEILRSLLRGTQMDALCGERFAAESDTPLRPDSDVVDLFTALDTVADATSPVCPLCTVVADANGVSFAVEREPIAA